VCSSDLAVWREETKIERIVTRSLKEILEEEKKEGSEIWNERS
jgi:hypothetical protein